SSPSWPWTSRCSRRSPKKSGDRRRAAAGRAPPPGALRRLGAPRLPRAGPAALDAAAATEEGQGGRGPAGGADAGAGAQAPALRLPADLGLAAARGLARQPQAGSPPLEAAGAESAAETAEEAAAGEQRQQLRAAAGRAQGPRLGVGLPA